MPRRMPSHGPVLAFHLALANNRATAYIFLARSLNPQTRASLTPSTHPHSRPIHPRQTRPPHRQTSPSTHPTYHSASYPSNCCPQTTPWNQRAPIDPPGLPPRHSCPIAGTADHPRRSGPRRACRRCRVRWRQRQRRQRGWKWRGGKGAGRRANGARAGFRGRSLW